MTCAANKQPRLGALLGLLLCGAAAPAAAMTLGEALQRAAGHDPSVASAQALYDAESEAGELDRGTLRPVLSASGKYEYARTESDGVFGAATDKYNSWSTQLQASQPLFRLDWFARGDRADARDALAEINLADRRQQLLRRVAERYFGVLNAQDQVGQAVAEANAVRESLEDTRKRYEVELVPGTDLKEAQARDDLAQARLLADEWIRAAHDSSPRIASARQNVIVAEADRRSRVSDAAPTLDLVASAGRDDSSDYMFGQEVDDARVGVQLSVPLYAGGVVQAAKRQASAQLRFAQAELIRVSLETERQTRQLFNQVQTAYVEVDAYGRALGSAQSAETATRAGYEAGTRTITDVLDAQSRTVQARLNYDNTRYSLLLSLLQLKEAVGRLSEKDFAEIDRLLQYPANP